jgi:hypothetical protein
MAFILVGHDVHDYYNNDVEEVKGNHCCRLDQSEVTISKDYHQDDHGGSEE